jgi:tRNA G18 (ribose-2'-O)-methylase SpoU
MTYVSSMDDPRVSAFSLLARPTDLVAGGLTLLEGRLVVERAVDRRRPELAAVLLTPAAAAAMAATVARIPPAVPVFVAPQAVMNGLAGFNIHRGCLALARRLPTPALADVDLAAVSRVVVLEGVSNPDNVGGLFRNAAAFGVDLVVLGPGCGDPLYRKSIRTSMGAALHVPFADAGRWPEGLAALVGAGLEVWALTPAIEAEPLRTLAPPSRVALLLGAEGAGLTPAARAAAGRQVRIEMADAAIDSLNVATAAAVALWWLHAGR